MLLRCSSKRRCSLDPCGRPCEDCGHGGGKLNAGSISEAVNWIIQYLLKPFVTIAGLGATGFLYYQALRVAPDVTAAIRLFMAAVGVLFLFTGSIHALEWIRNRDDPIVRLGHFTHSSDYRRSSTGDESWKANFSTSVLWLTRPRLGKEIRRVHCHVCSEVAVEVWSFSRALRNKATVVLVYSVYGFYWVFLVHMWPGLRENAPCLVQGLVGLTGFAAVFPGLLLALAGLPFLLSSWGGTESGVGTSHLFLGSTTLDEGHKVFPPS